MRNGDFPNANVFTAWEGLRLLGVETLRFEPDEIDDLDLVSEEAMVVGSIRTVRHGLERLGVGVGFLDAAAPELERFYGRQMRASTLREVRRSDAPLFVKPLYEAKAFTGYVRRVGADDVNR